MNKKYSYNNNIIHNLERYTYPIYKNRKIFKIQKYSYNNNIVNSNIKKYFFSRNNIKHGPFRVINAIPKIQLDYLFFVKPLRLEKIYSNSLRRLVMPKKGVYSFYSNKRPLLANHLKNNDLAKKYKREHKYNNLLFLHPAGVAYYTTLHPIILNKRERNYFSVYNKFIFSLVRNYWKINNTKISKTALYYSWAKQLQLIPYSFLIPSNAKNYMATKFKYSIKKLILLYLNYYGTNRRKTNIFLVKRTKKKIIKKIRKLKRFPIDYFNTSKFFKAIIHKNRYFSKFNFRNNIFIKTFRYQKLISIPSFRRLNNYFNLKHIISLKRSNMFRLKYFLKKYKEFYFNYFTKKLEGKKVVNSFEFNFFTYNFSYNLRNPSLYFFANKKEFIFQSFPIKPAIKKKRNWSSFLPQSSHSLIISNSRSNFFFSLVNAATGGSQHVISSGKLSFQTAQEKRSVAAFRTLCVAFGTYFKNNLKSIKSYPLKYIKFIINFNINKIKFNNFYIRNLISIFKKLKIRYLRFIIVLKRPHSFGTRLRKLKRK